MNTNKHTFPLLDEAKKLRQLKEKEKRRWYWRILLAIVAFFIVACITIVSVIAITWTRRNAAPPVVWRHNVGDTVASAPLIADGVAYFGTLGEDNPAFYALDTVAGQELWHTPASDSVFYWLPAIAHNKVFFATDDGYFLALDAQTGQEQWRFSPDQRQENLPDDPECLWCALKFRPPTIANGIIYVASHDKCLYALDALSGSEQWRFYIGELAFYAPVVVDGLVYVGSHDGYVHILDAATGTEQRRYSLGQEVWSVLIEGGVLYATVDEYLVALNQHTGVEQWRVRHPWSEWGSFTGRLHMDDKRLYLMSTDRLTAVNKIDGMLAWQFDRFHGSVFSEPSVAEGIVVVGDSDSYLYILDASTGRLIRRYYMVRHDPTSELSYTAEFVFDPTIVDGVIYFGWYDHLYAVQAPN